MILDQRPQIGYEGISQLAVVPFAISHWHKKEKNFCLLPSSLFLLPDIRYIRYRIRCRTSFSMIPVISSIPVVQLASGDRLSLQVYQFQGAIPETKGYI